MRQIVFSWVGFTLIQSYALGQTGAVWSIRIEEPTGLYPRTNEVVAVPYDRIGGKQPGWRVIDQQGREVPWQATPEGLLFPATLIPGELPEYRVAGSADTNSNFVT